MGIKVTKTWTCDLCESSRDSPCIPDGWEEFWIRHNKIDSSARVFLACSECYWPYSLTPPGPMVRLFRKAFGKFFSEDQPND